MRERSDRSGDRPMHRDLLGMLAVWVFSLPALLLSALLTELKFRSDHHCDAGLLSTCNKGWFTCTTIFQDRWSTVAGLPLQRGAGAAALAAATRHVLPRG